MSCEACEMREKKIEEMLAEMKSMRGIVAAAIRWEAIPSHREKQNREALDNLIDAIEAHRKVVGAP